MGNKSPFFVEARPLTRVDLLRERLDRLESSIGRLGNIDLTSEALEIPELLDQACEALEELKREGNSVPEEEARLETITSQLKQKAIIFVRTIGGAQALQKAREVETPGPERWWWFLDQWLVEGRRRRAKQTAINAVIGVAVLVLLGVLYQAFLAPSPQEQAIIDYQTAADQYQMQGNLEGALQEIEKALAVSPQDPDLLIRKGVLQQALGREAEAALTYAQAEKVLGDRKEFLLRRAQSSLGVGNLDAAIADANSVLQIDPESPEAYMMLGQAYELQQKYQEAIAAYEKTGKLADARNRPEITALARVRLAYLMQRIPAGGGP